MAANPDRRTFLSTAGALTLAASSYARVMGANARVGLGLVGYGLIGQTHARTFGRLDDAELVTVCDVHKARRAEGIRAIGGRVGEQADFRKVLDDKAVQAIIVATPDHWHALMTMMACAAGKDVYVEKPLTLFVREGEWMQTIARRTQRVVQVGTQQRSGAHYARARELIRGGHLGTVTSVRMRSVRNVFPGFGSPPDGDPPAELDYDAWLGPAPARRFNPNRSLYHFRWFWDYSGGQMTNLGAHHLDIVEWVLGLHSLGSVSSLGGRYALRDNGETPDTQDAVFDVGSFTVSFEMREAAMGERTGHGLVFHGTRGSLGIDRRGFTVTADPDIPPENQIPGILSGHPAGGPRAVQEVDPTRLRTESLKDSSGNSDAQYLAHARNFIDCVKSRKAPISDLASAHRTSVACHLANLSQRLGRSLRWDAKSDCVLSDAEANRALVRTYRTPWDRELAALHVEAKE
jgi:predicted dehydrogenase